MDGRRVVVVTGGGSGIGAATCRAFDADGAAVIVADLDEARAASVAAGLASGSAMAIDVSDPESVDTVIDRVVTHHRRLDVVVNGAGVDDPQAKIDLGAAVTNDHAPNITAGLDDTRWRRVLGVNLDGTFHVLRASLRAMIPRGSGRFIAIGSSAGFDTPLGFPHYSASKAAVHALCQSVAKEVVGFGVRVNVVAPGPTDTPMAHRASPELRALFNPPGSRPPAEPDEIAAVVRFLASDAASNVVGEVVLANGGRFTV